MVRGDSAHETLAASQALSHLSPPKALAVMAHSLPDSPWPGFHLREALESGGV